MYDMGVYGCLVSGLFIKLYDMLLVLKRVVVELVYGMLSY